MKRSGFAVTLAAAVALGWAGRSVFSDDPPAQPAGPSPEDWMKFAQPGEEQTRLKALVGEWNAHVKMTEDGKVTETEGTTSMTMILGDRYLLQEAHGSFGGQPFEGRGLIGFDKGSKRWVSTWIDTMSTGILFGEGEETVKGASWSFKSTFNGPTGPIAMRDVVTVVSDKALKWESYMGGADKPMMTIDFTRK